MAQGQAMQMVPLKVGGDLSPATDGTGTTPAEVATATEDQSSANVEKIRDILFGVQIREYESRFARLEENLLKETTDLRESAKKRLDALESYVRSEIESLQTRLKNDREERTNSSRQAARTLDEIQAALTTRISDLDEQTSQTD